MTVSLFSYAGKVTVGFLADAGIVSDPQPLADAFRAELLALARRARTTKPPEGITHDRHRQPRPAPKRAGTTPSSGPAPRPPPSARSPIRSTSTGSSARWRSRASRPRRPRRARARRDRLRRARGQGGQELRRDRVPLRPPRRQALGRRDRRGPRARHRVRRRADRRRARAAADHQPDLDRAVQVHRRRQDAQRDHLPPVGARRTLRRPARSRSSSAPARPRACRRMRCRSSPTRRWRPPSTSSTIPAST